ncbi:MAG: type IV pilus secretin PilQ [Azonexus sp.]|jgi:type IV pilus assembly protein PilQ|nr:type IV pilus secretin PilQ [Azonexus sp.]
MKFVNTVLLAASVCLVLATPLRAEEGADANNAIETISAVQQGGDIAVRVDLREPLTMPPASFSVNSPARVALDFPATVNGLGKSNQILNEGDLRSFNVVQVGDRTRLVLNLVRNMNYSTRVDGKSLYVTLTPINRLVDSVAERGSRFAEESLMSSPHALRDVTFRRGKDGEGRVVVELSDPGAGIDIRQQGRNLIVDFQKTTVPEHLRRRLDVTDFATPVTMVETKSMGDNVRMIISPTGLWEHNAYQSDNQFVVEVKKIVEDPNKLVQGTKVGYQGPRVSINYQNGDVRALLRLMAEELGFNAVISETVTGTTTLVLKDVPADQVIDIIFQQKGLDMRKKGNIVMIAPRDEIATREKLDFEARQQISELEPLQTEVFVLNYHRAEDVAKLLAGLAPLGGAPSNSALKMLSKRGSTIADLQSNQLFVTDIPSKMEEIRAFIKAIDIGTRQVLIEARVVEATDSFNRDIGIKLGLINSKPVGGYSKALGGSLYGVGGTMAPAVTTGTGSPPTLTQTPMAGVNLPGMGNIIGTGGTFALSLFNSSATRILNLELAALESDGGGKIISSPRVVTANNVKAKIEDGTEVPYLSTQQSGGSAGSLVAQTVTFKEAKLVLEVTPQITPEGTVRMTLLVKKEEPDWTNMVLGNPPIKSSIVETDVVVENGGTVVIGGVFVTNNQHNVEKVPLLGDIPFFGWLFKYKNDIGERRELLVFITPRILSEKLRLE